LWLGVPFSGQIPWAEASQAVKVARAIEPTNMSFSMGLLRARPLDYLPRKTTYPPTIDANRKVAKEWEPGKSILRISFVKLGLAGISVI
jgi:hypothetical protein